MKANREAIADFLSINRLAVAGVSRNEKKFGRVAFNELRKKGFDVLPINPNAENLDGVTCYKDVISLPSDIDRLLIITPKKETENIVKQAIDKGIKKIWIQQMSDTKESLELAQSNGLDPIQGQCILMWVQPVQGFHHFHRSLKKLFRRL
ncbi:MAG: CoA-binding protein [Bacteroidota bacterium]|nr:CoA-binding protein [Bacteroidota bacterium]